MKYVLEPSMFAIDKNMSEEDFKKYVKRLLQWEKWLDRYPEDIYVLSNTDKVLFDMEYYPIYPVFEELMKRYKIDYVRANLLEQAIQKLLYKSKRIDMIGNEKVDDDLILIKARVENGIDSESHPGTLKESLEKVLWCLYCQCRRKNDKIESYAVFGRNLKTNVNIRLEYQTIVEDNGELKEVRNKETINVFCRSSLVDFFRCEDVPTSILTLQEGKKDIDLAVRVAVYQKGELKKMADSFDNYKFVIQDTFHKDYLNAHYMGQRSFLNSFVEAMSHTLLSMNMKNREDFRTGKGGNNSQMSHGEYLAWRRYVTQSVKMQYWQRDSHFKFANIGEHDYFECKWED